MPRRPISLRMEVSSVLHKARLPTGNLNKGLSKVLMDLQKDDNVVFLPADKGKITIVTDRTEYVGKMIHMLDDETYKTLAKNPTSKVDTRITKALRGRATSRTKRESIFLRIAPPHHRFMVSQRSTRKACLSGL